MQQFQAFATGSVTLAWFPSPDTNVVSYNIYYGCSSGNYTNKISAGNATNAVVSGLADGAAYYFAATALDDTGMESPFSNEISYSIPGGGGGGNSSNRPPTLNPIKNVSIKENASAQTIALTGITDGSTNETQTLTITATSSNPSLIPNPTVNYTSPGATGTLTFEPAFDAHGTATITVTVNDGQAQSNLCTRTFLVTVSFVNQPPTLDPIANVTMYENGGLQMITLTGISSGATNENQKLRVTAASSNRKRSRSSPRDRGRR